MATNAPKSGLAKHFFGTVWRSPQGKVLLSLWGAYIAWVVSLRKQKKEKKPTEKKEEDAKKKQESASQRAKQDVGLRKLLELLKPRMFKREGAIFALYVLSLCSRVLITVHLSDVSGRVAGYMGARKWSKMFRGQAWFGLVCILAAGTTTAMKFLEKHCALAVKSTVFEHLKNRYLETGPNRYFHQDLSDASARLTSDLDEFSEELVHLVGHFLKPLIDIAHLSTVMWYRIGFSNLSIFYAFFWFSDFSLGRVRNRALRKSLKQCAMERQQLQSELRGSLHAIHHYREQIAMQRGTDHEREAVNQQFDLIKKTSLLENAQYALVDFTSSYTLKYGGMMTAFSILTPSSYYDPTRTGEEITTSFFSNSNLLGALASAVKDMADSFSRLPKVRGLAERVFQLEERMILVDKAAQEAHDNVIQVDTDNNAIVLENVSVIPPAPLGKGQCNKPLLRDVNLRITQGEHHVIRGANGLGKSSLGRTIMGLWPVGEEDNSKGKSRIIVPESIFVLPQDTYLPKITLKEQITYPLSGSLLSKEEAVELLTVVGLEELLARYDLEGAVDWNNSLSGGQKQRLGWARLFFHRPRFALLDEATSAISKDTITQLFQHAKSLNMTLLTISHTPQVDAEHSYAIDLIGDGQFKHGPMTSEEVQSI